MPPSLVLSTRNAHKVREFRRLLPGVDVQPLPDDVELPPETGSTFAENAAIKARAAAVATGLPAIADDSGVEADALGGRPGVYSARFAGPDGDDAANLAKLRAEAPAGSGLHYVCVIAYVDADGAEQLFEGTCSGTMAAEPRGVRGFGYDPVFVPAGTDAAGSSAGRTMAELTDHEKDAISHRGRAARALLAALGA
jgi:XTP/dITP diphosphohydrolase